MNFTLNEEKATDVLIWWVEAADGSIDYREDEVVRDVLEDMNYSMKTFYEDTLLYISGLSNEHMKELVEKAIQWASEHFSDHRKQVTLALLHAIASCTGKVTDSQQEKLDRLEKEFGV